MRNPLSPTRAGALLSIAGFSLFACSDALTKHLGGLYTVNTVAFYMSSLMVVMLTVASLIVDGPRRLYRTKQLGWHALRGAFITGQFMLLIYGFIHLGLAKSYAIIFSAPFFTVLLAALFMKEPLSLAKSLPLVAGFAGVLVVLRPGIIPIDLPSLAVLVSAVAFSVANLLAKRSGRSDDSFITKTLLPEIFTMLLTLPLFVYHPQLPPLREGLVFGVATALSALGSLCTVAAFIRVPASVAAPFHYSQMLWGLLFGALFFGDHPDVWTLAGAVIIIASGLWLMRLSDDKSDSIPEALVMPPLSSSAKAEDPCKEPRQRHGSSGQAGG